MNECQTIGPLQDLAELSTFSSDIDLTAETVSTLKRPARWLRVEAVSGAASLVLKVGAGRGVSRTVTVSAGWEITAELVGITASGTANVTRVTVGW